MSRSELRTPPSESDFGGSYRSSGGGASSGGGGGCGCVIMLVVVVAFGYWIFSSVKNWIGGEAIAAATPADPAPQPIAELAVAGVPVPANAENSNSAEAPDVEAPPPETVAASTTALASAVYDAPSAIPEENRGAKTRVWEDAQGRLVEAEFARYEGGEVELVSRDGHALKTPLSSLSVGDRRYLMELAASTDPLAATLQELSIRTWSDSTGNFEVEAAAVTARADDVELLRLDGQIIVVPIARLSDSDAELLRESFDRE